MSAAVILVVDDNPGDATLIKQAIDDVCPGCRFFWVENGPRAFEYLLKRGDFAGTPDPDLMVLDIRLPLMEGFQILELIRAHPVLAKTRVVMWSSSRRPQDIERAAKLGALAYIPKGVTWEHQIEIARQLVALLPPVGGDRA